MTFQNYHARAELYLGSDHATALAQGARNFASVAQALRFAFEEAAPVSLRGAKLAVEGQSFSGDDLLALYRARNYPLVRKGDISRSRQRRALGRRVAAFHATVRPSGRNKAATA